MPTATFAQLCGHLETVVDSSASVFDLYHDISCSSIHKQLHIQTFMDLFYDQGVFKIRDCCDNLMVLHNWLVEPSGTSVHSAIPITMDPSNCDIFSLVRDQWILDASNNCGIDISANWGTCSYMNMVRELIPSGNLCNWKCLTCCALTAKELADVLNYEEYTNNGNVWPAGSVARTPVSPVTWGDELILAVRFTNLNSCVDPIELRLHFFIGWTGLWHGFCDNPNIFWPVLPLQSYPVPGFFCAAGVSRAPGTRNVAGQFLSSRPTLSPAPCPGGDTEVLWIHKEDCCRAVPQIFAGLQPVLSTFANWRLRIEGMGTPTWVGSSTGRVVCDFPGVDFTANYLILGGSWLGNVLELKVASLDPPCSNPAYGTRWPQYNAAAAAFAAAGTRYAFRFTFTPP